MRKTRLAIIVMALCLGVCACSFRGASASEAGSGAPIHVAIELAAMRSSTDEEVDITFRYGHAYPDDFDSVNLLGHTLEVFLTSDVGDAIDPGERVVLSERHFEGTAFLSEANRCDVGLPLFGRVSYRQSLTLSVDFSDLAFTRGLIVIRLSETTVRTSEVGGERLEQIVTVHRSAFFIFTIEDDVILFSTRRVE
ncbi:MAG TPA: hypothetical protein DCR44_00645 [Acholeplasmatales bacterium]|nr:MAG: hypothetical protein A2Y16_03365 [Tenericutes bacterium GWF2_57_13]HAQ55907.1 hypothetical protein [Acholeplasmatales bacterium]